MFIFFLKISKRDFLGPIGRRTEKIQSHLGTIVFSNNCHKMFSLTSLPDYRVGRNIARSFADYYKYLGVISSPPKKMHRKTNKQSNGRTRSKKIRARMGFSKVRKKTYKRRHLHKPKTNVVQEVTDVEMQSKVDVKKGHIDFSNVMFPPISGQKTIKRKLLPVRQQCIRTSTLEKDELRLSSELKILKIG